MKIVEASNSDDYTLEAGRISWISYREGATNVIQLNMHLASNYLRELRFILGTELIQTRYKSGSDTGNWVAV